MSQFEKFGNIKDKLKKAVAIGAATAVFGGIGGLEAKEASAGMKVKDKGKIASTENSKSKDDDKRAKLEKKLLEEYRKAKREADDSFRKIKEAKNKSLKVAIEKEERVAEKIKNELIEHIKSQDYLNKLKIEFGGDIYRAKVEQAKRIENLKTVKINVLYFNEVNEEYKKCFKREGVPIPDDFKGCWGFYDPDAHGIFVSFGQYKGETTLHELLHASTRGNEGVTDSAQNILKKSYENRQGFLELIDDKKDAYFSNPTERLVRKQALDKELEKREEKKYGEIFTDEHYKKMMELYKKGVLSDNVIEFIKRTKPEDFKKIMNEIAKNKSGESPETNQV